MATLATNVKQSLVSELTNLHIAALGSSVMSRCFGGIESIIDKLVFLSKVEKMLMLYVDDYDRMFRSMLTCDTRVGVINIRCTNKHRID